MTELIMRNHISTPALTALTADTPAAILWDESDEKMVLVVQNTASSDATLTVKAGNGIQGVVDLTLTVPKNAVSLVKLDSGRFKNVSGENKGKIVVVSATALKVGATAMV